VNYTLHHGDCLEVLPTLPDQSVHCCVTSPPYWGLRDYGHEGQLGLEPTPEAYVAKLVAVFREVWRVLRDDGTLWLNLGDSYAGGGRGSGGDGPTSPKQRTNLGAYFDGNTDFDHGLKPKDLVGIPWRVAFALQADGWYLRSDIIWAKPNPMPESVRDRPTKAHEYVFLLSKQARYWYDAEAVSETMPASSIARYAYGFGGEKAEALVTQGIVTHPIGNRATTGTRNRRTVWHIATQPFPEAHFAVMPEKLVEPCVLAGCPAGGTVLDPFSGAGTVGVVACRLGRDFIGIELNESYVEMARRRIEPYAAQGRLALA